MTKSKCCVSADIEVTKKLLTVSRVPLAGLVQYVVDNSSLPPNVHYAQLLLTYEIIITNNTPHKLVNIDLNDTLAGINFEENGASSLPFPSLLEIIKANQNIVLLTPEQIATSNGSLIDSTKSYLPPCSITKILVKLSISAPKNSFCEVRQVCNTVTLEGALKIKNKDNKKCFTLNKIKPIVAYSEIWSTESDFGFIVGLNINVNINIPA